MTLLKVKMANHRAAFQPVVTTYLNRLQQGRVDHVQVVQTWYGPVQLTCIIVDPQQPPPGFRRSTNDPMPLFQYDLRTAGLGRPKAIRIPFLLEDAYDDDDYTVSHLCHQRWCLNPRHCVLETLPDNKGRNGCPGGNQCRHQNSCLIPGPYHQGLSGVLPQFGLFQV
jgi:hypothetical protein